MMRRASVSGRPVRISPVARLVRAIQPVEQAAHVGGEGRLMRDRIGAGQGVADAVIGLYGRGVDETRGAYRVFRPARLVIPVFHAGKDAEAAAWFPQNR